MGEYVFTEKYCIGQGSYGKVYRGRNIKTGKEVAIKEMDGQLITEQEIYQEITILKQLKHPNIVEYEDAFQVRSVSSRTMDTSTSLQSTARAGISGTCWIAMRRSRSRRRRKYCRCCGKCVRGLRICENST
jgi:serine/threonine protein kinase